MIAWLQMCPPSLGYLGKKSAGCSLSHSCQAPRPWLLPPASACLPALPSSLPVIWLWAQVPGKETIFWGHHVACQPSRLSTMWLGFAEQISPTSSSDYFSMFSIFQTLILSRYPPFLITGPALTFPSGIRVNVSRNPCQTSAGLCPQHSLQNYASFLLNAWLPRRLEVLWELGLCPPASAIDSLTWKDSQFASLQPTSPVYSSQVNHFHHVIPSSRTCSDLLVPVESNPNSSSCVYLITSRLKISVQWGGQS